MKKKITYLSLFTLLLTFGSLITFAQQRQEVPCSASLSSLFLGQRAGTPQLLNKLGTAPQFGKIPQHQAESAYNHLAGVYKKNKKGSRREIDRILQALGYSGFNDPNFSASKIIPEVVPKGTLGWMGAYGKGHTYKWSVTGRDFNAFKVVSNDGKCSLYVMQICGNAFHSNNPVYENVLFEPDPIKVTCKTQTITVQGSNEIRGGNVVNTTIQLPIIASYNSGSANSTLCMGTQDLPVRITYDIGVNGVAKYVRTVQICDRGDYAIPANANLIMPINLNFDVTGTEVEVEGGAIKMNINEKQYRELGKVFNACPTDLTNASVDQFTSSGQTEITSSASASSDMGSISSSKCKKQTLNFVASASGNMSSARNTPQNVTIIGVFKEEGKTLKMGDKSTRFLCLGNYDVTANSLINYTVVADAKTSKIIDACDDGTVKDLENFTVPLNISQNVTKQDIMIGDYGKIYIPLTQHQYKVLSKKFGRCCSNATLEQKCK